MALRARRAARTGRFPTGSSIRPAAAPAWSACGRRSTRWSASAGRPTGTRPQMVSVQAEHCAPIVRAFEQGAERSEMWQNARTVADGLRVPKAIGDFLVLRAVRESGGTALAVTRRRHGARHARARLARRHQRRARRRRGAARGQGAAAPTAASSPTTRSSSSTPAARSSTSEVRRNTCYVLRATCYVTCYVHVRRATCNVRRATRHVRRGTCDVQRATCDVRLGGAIDRIRWRGIAARSARPQRASGPLRVNGVP